MTNRILKTGASIFFVIISICVRAQTSYLNKIWYRTPANASIKDNPDGWISDSEWLKALPVGNGSLGAMVFGDVNKERIQLNEMSLWSGSNTDNNNPEAPKHLAEIRELLFAGKFKEATALTDKTQIAKGKGSGQGNAAVNDAPFGCFQTLGDLYLDFGTNEQYSDYYRNLDLTTGIATTQFTINGVGYTREVFASHSDKAIVIRLVSSEPNAISFNLSVSRPEKSTTVTEGNRLAMFGTLSNGKGGNGMKYKTYVTPHQTGGTLKSVGNTLQINNATAVTIIITAKTNYKLHFPDYINPGWETELASITKTATSKEYESLKQTHIKDFSGFMNRVSFIVGNASNDIPTDELIAKNFESKNEQAIYPLYFQYGRYLLLSSSRAGGLPANLQGIWANKIQTPWNGDYHTDINVQMNYWPAEVTNLSESHLPLIDLILSLLEPGKKTAAVQYNMNGWVLHPITNVWGYTSPGEEASWGMHIGGGGWLVQDLWEHYAFTKDKIYLARVYPMLKAASSFYLDWLVKNPETGKLVSGPSPSPENSFIAPDSSVAAISMGPTHDQEVIFNLFNNTLQAAAVLGIKDDVFISRMKSAENQLQGIQISSDGRIMEWAEEYKEVELTHRHLSHLFAVYPGNQIGTDRTPELAIAAKKSLDVRGDGGVGLSYAWKIALWARLKDGNRALKILNSELRPSSETGTKYSDGGGTYYNLFNAGPPFQIDANFGAIAGMSEMFLQSQEDFIELLPALPDAWKDGDIKGLVARGAFVVNMEWKDGKLNGGSISSKKGGSCYVKYKDKMISLKLAPKQSISLANKF